MSDTPRTDAAAWREHQQSVVGADFARQLERELAALKTEVAQRTAERDEARREACHFEAKYLDRCACPPYMSIAKYVTQDALRLAKERGWDCFEVKP
jgi:hypothetical protein